jgi:hypothetical protein
MRHMAKRRLLQLIIGWIAWLGCVGGVGTNTIGAQSLVVVVKNAAGKPVLDASVRVHNANGQTRQPDKARKGAFTFVELSPEFNALLVEKPGFQPNGFQWFVAQPDTVRMVMRQGAEVVIYDEVEEEDVALKLYQQWILIRRAEGASEAAFLDLMRDCELLRDTSHGLYRWKGGTTLTEFNSTVLSTLRRNPLVETAYPYAERIDRMIKYDYGDEAIFVEHPDDGKMIYPCDLLEGRWDVTFDKVQLSNHGGKDPLRLMDSVMRQYGFRVDADRYY